MSHIQAGDMQEAWCSVQGWYTEARAQQAKKCHTSMENQTVEREELYGPTTQGPNPLQCPKDAH